MPEAEKTVRRMAERREKAARALRALRRTAFAVPFHFGTGVGGIGGGIDSCIEVGWDLVEPWSRRCPPRGSSQTSA